MGLFTKAAVLYSLVIVGIDMSFGVTVPSNHTSNFEKAGFILIGSMSDTNVGKGAIQSIGTSSISLFLSPENNKVTQDQAVRQCKYLYGDLLFILNDQQYQDVRSATNRIEDAFWTSAMYDEPMGGFVWSHVGMPVLPSFFRTDNEADCQQKGLDRGLSVDGVLSAFGLCSEQADKKLRYICRV